MVCDNEPLSIYANDTDRMPLTVPTLLTLLRIALIPVLVVFFYLPYSWSNFACAFVFVSAAVTDWLDGWLARKTSQMSNFGAFLDPVADKLMVATALILLVQQHPRVLFALAAAIIVGREIAISALREWMAELGESGRVTVTWYGKIKTIFQMTAIGFLLYREDIWFLPVSLIGQALLYIAALLTLWSMWTYLSAAWPVINQADSDHSKINSD
jgi:CDP-diacylglycerol--glycerol-3-phosphate 3-phosphatidyltransferase